MGYRNYSVANGFIVDKLGNGDFKTIQAAITAASSGDTIFVRPGTYTENLTLKAGVDLAAFVTDSDIPNVIINGTCTFTAAGTIGISGIELVTNSSFFLTVSGSAASVVYLNDCFLNCLNNTGIDFTSSSASAAIYLNDCSGNIATTGIAYFTQSSPGLLAINYCQLLNSGASVTPSTTSSGNLNFYSTRYIHNLAISGTGIINFYQSEFGGVPAVALALTTSGVSGGNFSSFNGDTATAITIGATSTLIVDFVDIFTSATNAISGAGVLEFGLINYSSTSASTSNVVTTQSPTTVQGGTWSRIYPLSSATSASLSFINLPSYPIYAFIINSLGVATNTASLEMVVSSNNGSTYSNSGYLAGINYNSYNSATVNNSNSTTFAPITGPVNNGAGFGGTIFFTPGNGVYWGTVTYDSTTTGTYVTGTCGGSTGVVANAFKFQASTGNLSTGSITIYGITQ